MKASGTMDLNLEDAPTRGLRHYVWLMAHALGLSGDAWFVQLERPADAYIALKDRFAAFPRCDLALIWDEENGWAVALESDQAELVPLCYLGGDVLPTPRAVAMFVGRILHGQSPGFTSPPRLRSATDQDDLADRLATYASPGFGEAAAVAEDLATTAIEDTRMTVHARSLDHAVVLHVAGEIDIMSEYDLTQAINRALEQAPELLVVDLTHVRFLGPAGLAVLVAARDRASRRTHIRIVAAGLASIRPLEIAGLLTTLAIYPTLQAALIPRKQDEGNPAV
jgi:anti-anti-sigma factor